MLAVGDVPLVDDVAGGAGEDRGQSDVLAHGDLLALADGDLRAPADLSDQVLLHDKVDDTPEDPGWAVWCRAAGIAMPDAPARHFSDAALVLQAATAGQGVALARLSLVREDLESARLVRPFGPVVRTRFSYYAVATPALAQQPRVHAMVDWLVAQARGQADDPLLAEAIAADGP